MILIHHQRDLILLCAVILLIVAIGAWAIQNGKQTEYPPYSSYAHDDRGMKAAYLLLEKLGFKTSRWEKVRPEKESASVMILVEPDEISELKANEIMELCQWVYEGHKMVLIGNASKFFDSARFLMLDEQQRLALPELAKMDIDPEEKYNIPYGKGSFRFYKNTSLFTNEGLRKKGNATRWVTLLWEFQDQPVQFYEYSRVSVDQQNLNGEEKTISLLQLIGFPGQLLLIQLMLAFVLFAFWKGRRLGLAVPLLETEKYEEEEATQSLGRLMEQANLKEDALTLYYEIFQAEAAHYFKSGSFQKAEELEQAWQRNEMKNLQKLKEVDACIAAIHAGKKIKNETTLQAFQRIDALREEIHKK